MSLQSPSTGSPDLTATSAQAAQEKPRWQVVGLVVGYGVLGALFMPFLAITLLVLPNSRRVDPAWRNGLASNALLGLTSLIFVVLGVDQLRKAIGTFID